MHFNIFVLVATLQSSLAPLAVRNLGTRYILFLSCSHFISTRSCVDFCNTGTPAVHVLLEMQVHVRVWDVEVHHDSWIENGVLMGITVAKMVDGSVYLTRC
jgi:hypothetical protein